MCSPSFAMLCCAYRTILLQKRCGFQVLALLYACEHEGTAALCQQARFDTGRLSIDGTYPGTGVTLEVWMCEMHDQ